MRGPDGVDIAFILSSSVAFVLFLFTVLEDTVWGLDSTWFGRFLIVFVVCSGLFVVFRRKVVTA